jgi:hypothetical protein
MTQIPKGVLDQIEADVTKLVIFGEGYFSKRGAAATSTGSHSLSLDPYDAVPDWYGVLGYPDDIAVLRKTHAAILRN